MWNSIKSKLSDVTEVARYAIFGCGGVIILMWLLNIWGHQTWNGFFGFVGLLLVVFLAISPKVIMPSAALTGLIALLGKNNPLRGAIQGPRWVVSVARSFLYGFLFFATFLTFWSFENSPAAFWGIFLVAIMLFIWRERYGSMGNYAKWIEWTYIVVCAIALLWSTFGDAYQGRSFDPWTGEPTHMVDPMYNTIDGRSPQECRPEGVPHEGFNYAENGKCRATRSGLHLVPMNPDQALSRDVTAWPGLGAETVQSSTGIPLPLIVIIVAMLAGAIWLWNGKKGKPIVLAVALVTVGWAGYTYVPAVAASIGINCTDRDTVDEDGYFTLRKSCENQSIQTPSGFDPRFHIEDSRFTGAFDEWVYAAWDENRGNTINFTNLQWPPQATEVEVRMVSVQEAAEIDAAAEHHATETLSPAAASLFE